MPADRDPFEGLCLDEGFVRAARFIEPSALERRPDGDSKRTAPCQVVPAHRGLPGFFHRLISPPEPVPRRRRAARVLAIAALTVGMVSLAVVLLRQNVARTQSAARPSPVLAGPAVEASASAPASNRPAPGGPAATVAQSPSHVATGVEVPASVVASLTVGTCLTWSQDGASVTGLEVVDCQAEHRGEVTRVIDLAERFSAWPGRGALDGVVAQSCPSALADHVDAERNGLLPRAAGAYPAAEGWIGPSRILACLVVDQGLGSWSGPVRTAERVA